MNRLDAASEARLTLVGAPAGSGKTVALAQWHRQTASGRPVAWLRLDARHDAAELFAAELLEAVRIATGAAPAPCVFAPASDPRPIMRLADALLGRLADAAPDLVIVLDDIDLLRSPAARRLLGRLVADAPPQLRWIFSGRDTTVVDTSALLLEGELRTLGAEALRLDVAAVQQLARSRADVALSTDAADAVVRSTEGWAAGVAMALAATTGRTEAPPAITGDRVDVAAYFTAAVLTPLPPRLRRFLIETSVATVLSGDLCNALLGIDDGQAALEALADRRCFLVPLDGHARWFRHHRLFHEFLRSRLKVDAARLPTLHERASRWFASQQRDADALEHAFASGRERWCRELLAACAARLRNAGDLHELVGWCERLPRARVIADPAIALPFVHGLVVLARFDAAAEALADLRAAGRAAAAKLDLLQWLLASLGGAAGQAASASASESTWPDDPTPASLAAPTAADIPPELDSVERGHLLTLQAYALVRASRFAAAWRCAMRASELLEATSAYGHGQAQVVAVLAERGQGDLRAATRRAARLHALADRGRRNATWVNAAVVLAHVRYDENRIGEAEALCLEVLPLLPIGASIEHRMTLCCTLARVQAGQGRFDEAATTLALLQARLEDRPQPRFSAQLCAEQIRLALARGRTGEARRIAAAFGLHVRFEAGEWRGVRPYDEAWERFGSAYAAFATAERRFDVAGEILAALRTSAHCAGDVYRTLGHDAMLASCRWQAGDTAGALRAVRHAFARSGGAGFLRTHFDDAPSLGRIVAVAVEQRALGELLPHRAGRRLRTLIESSGGEASPSAPAPRAAASADAGEALTARELEVLRLIALGLDNLQIGTRSRIAVSTVKWHVKNVFAKLGATSRVAALARARERRLLDD